MSLPDESVIIIDTPRKEAKSPVKKRKRAMGLRSPLKALHERAVAGGTGSCDVVKVTMRKKRGRSVGSTPNARKRARQMKKSENDNESVIVLSDDDDIQAISNFPSTSDFIPLETPNSRVLKKRKPKKSPLSRIAQWRMKKSPTKKTRRAKGRGILRKISDNKADVEVESDEDLEIVWASADAAEISNEQIEELTSEQPDVRRNIQQTFIKECLKYFADPTGDEALLDAAGSADEPKKKKKGKKKAGGKPPLAAAKKGSSSTNKRLREIIVDGCNVAGSHGGTGFSEKGLEIVLNYFTQRGHKVKIFIPQHKRSRDRQLIEKWHKAEIVVFTPSRKVGNKSITPYDDRFILKYAHQCKGIVISSDQFRDLWVEKPEWRETIEERILAPTFVGDYLMFPEDPLGKFGPTLDDFLSL